MVARPHESGMLEAIDLEVIRTKGKRSVPNQEKSEQDEDEGEESFFGLEVLCSCIFLFLMTYTSSQS